MTEKLYCLYDKVADRYTHFMLATSDGMYVRELIAHTDNTIFQSSKDLQFE